MKPISAEEYTVFRDFLHDIAGIDLAENKQYLVSTRVRKIVTENQCESLTELNALLKKGLDLKLRQKVIDAMTTNETFWFRDNYPFDYLKSTIFPEIAKTSTGANIKMWCAACSSGQEPYSIAITFDEFLKENFTMRSTRLDIQATDLSNGILEQAKSGEYDRLSISRGMSEQRLNEYFEPCKMSDRWHIKSKYKQGIRFRSLNLQESFVSIGKCDIVFCRNVLIYFSPELKQDILKRIRAVLKPGGYLFLGSSESLGAASDYFKMIHCRPGVVYQAI